MGEHDDWLARCFEEHRTHLRAVAYRMLGSPGDADDAVQEAWFRLSRSDTAGVENLGGWLTTVVGRVSLNMLRARRQRREESLGVHVPDPIVDRADGLEPEHEALLANWSDSRCSWCSRRYLPPSGSRSCCTTRSPCPSKRSGPSWGAPRQRRGNSPAARARRVRGAATSADASLACQREAVDAFLAASREGDFEALLVVLDPDIVLRIDGGAVRAGLSREVRGVRAVAKQTLTFSRLSPFVRPALVNGAAGVVVVPAGRPFAVMGFTLRRGKIVEIDVLADPARLRRLDLVVLDD